MPDVILTDGPEKAMNGRLKIPAPLIYILVWAMGMAISSFIGYAAAQSSTNARLSVLESQKQDIERRLLSIETKIDELLLRGARP